MVLGTRDAEGCAVLGARERAAEQKEREARFAWSWDDLVRGLPRSVELEWTPGEFDKVPPVDHQGDEPISQAPAEAGPAAGDRASKGG